MKKIFIALILLGFFSCHQPTKKTPASAKEEKSKPVIKIPDFNADSAYSFVAKQVEFGPRVPNTPQHQAAANYLSEKLGSYTDTLVIQEFLARAYDGTVLKGKNIIGILNPEAKTRVLLCAHWDTRPFADHDPDPARHNIPIDGANDGASGVGVLLEIARQLNNQPPKIGVDIILFDAEDYGPPRDYQKRGSGNWWALGSQHWANNPHDFDYYAKYGILLDMVGAHEARFYMEGYSATYAPGILKKVWNTAHQIGFGDYFIFEEQGYIDDDHKAINEIRKIPAIDIIHLDNNSSNNSFFEHWHTTGDNMSTISKETLRVVGQTVLTVVYEQK